MTETQAAPEDQKTYWGTKHQNKMVRTALRQMLFDYDAQYMITVNFNRTTSFVSARTSLKALQARVNRKLFGKHWLKLPQKRRTEFIAFAEHPHSNFHYHILFRVPTLTRKQTLIFRLFVEPLWQEMIEFGQVHVAKFATNEDRARAVSYVTKELYKTTHLENFIVSREFEK